MVDICCYLRHIDRMIDGFLVLHVCLASTLPFEPRIIVFPCLTTHTLQAKKRVDNCSLEY